MRYTLLDEIGRGASGTVHRAWDQRAAAYVAVKRLPIGTPVAGTGIHHPHVLCPVDRLERDGELLVVMRLVRGGSLLDLCRDEGRLPPAYVAVVLDQLLSALVAVHSVGVVHRDVKRANLLLDATGTGLPHLWLTDFGDESTIGTSRYLAPEREAGAPAHPSQDVYAAGVLLRRLLDGPGPLSTLADSMTRHQPERRPTAEAALARLRTLPTTRPQAWPRVPDRLGRLPKGRW